MSVSILEALQNAAHNLNNAAMSFQIVLAKSQLKNAVTLLEKGYSLHDEVEPLIDKYGTVEKVPNKQEQS